MNNTGTGRRADDAIVVLSINDHSNAGSGRAWRHWPAPTAVASAQRSARFRRTHAGIPATIAFAIATLAASGRTHEIHAQAAIGTNMSTARDSSASGLEWPPAVNGSAPDGWVSPGKQIEAQQRGDGWFGEDKLRHFLASYAVAAVGYGSARLVGIEPDAALALATGGAVAAGIGKEWADVRRGGPFSLKDLVYDAAGIAVALGILRNTR
jgi:uncharacterized protein YfiM (DUF2279 family)